jgi:hypothetical protein
MTCVAHAEQINLRFGDPVCKNLGVNGRVRAGDLPRERLHLFTEKLIGFYGQAQPVAKCVSC